MTLRRRRRRHIGRGALGQVHWQVLLGGPLGWQEQIKRPAPCSVLCKHAPHHARQEVRQLRTWRHSVQRVAKKSSILLYSGWHVLYRYTRILPMSLSQDCSLVCSVRHRTMRRMAPCGPNSAGPRQRRSVRNLAEGRGTCPAQQEKVLSICCVPKGFNIRDPRPAPCKQNLSSEALARPRRCWTEP